jgi:hypothetical protein
VTIGHRRGELAVPEAGRRKGGQTHPRRDERIERASAAVLITIAKGCGIFRSRVEHSSVMKAPRRFQASTGRLTASPPVVCCVHLLRLSGQRPWRPRGFDGIGPADEISRHEFAWVRTSADAHPREPRQTICPLRLPKNHEFPFQHARPRSSTVHSSSYSPRPAAGDKLRGLWHQRCSRLEA